ncbi:hypothetical protein FGG78_17135 [Thioclava sp. BHET1]|nr:hypothetical protein FGG78_17135 [Thioclava sp. BHET1]
MRIDGTYSLSIKTPLGEQKGTLVLTTDGKALSGSLQNAKGQVAFDGGTAEDGKVSFDTRIPTPIGKLKAHVMGTVVGDHFSGVAKLPLGKAEIEGYRTA